MIAVYRRHDVYFDIEPTDKKEYYCNEGLMADFKADPYRSLFYFGFAPADATMSASLAFVHSIVRQFVVHIARDSTVAIMRVQTPPEQEEVATLLNSLPFAVGIEFVDCEWLLGLWERLSAVFQDELAKFTGTVEEFLRHHNAQIAAFGRVYFHLVENKNNECPFAFLATYATEKDAVHMPLKNALLEYSGRQELLLNLLATVSKATNKSDFISTLVESGELFSPLKLTADEAYTFLREIPLYEESGIICRIPNWWKKKTNGIKLSLNLGDKEPAMLGLDALLSFNPQLCLGDEQLSRAEIEELLSKTEGLYMLKGKWVEVNHERLQAVLKAYEKADSLGEVTFAEAMRIQLGMSEAAGLKNTDTIEINNGQWLERLRTGLLNPRTILTVDSGAEFKANLRQYQQVGLNWLAMMKRFGFGALLADDMGLGKTVQILALLEHLRCAGDTKSLLVVPASLIGNWQREIEKFAPQLTYRVLHGKNAALQLQEKASLFITTYGMIMRLGELREHEWNMLILDEAQAIKNPTTKQTKAVKQIKAQFKIAMTGTPIENRLGDLWSLFDFLNTGLLGTAKEFAAFIKTLQAGEGYARLRDIITPFILRRLKTDKTIINDLPDKVEVKAYAAMSKKQVLLYNVLVNELKEKLETAVGTERRGIVFGALMKFKQICNHPDHYHGQGNYGEEDSGKFEKVREICETIREKRERVLVFTQFKEMTEPLARYLAVLFGKPGLVLHGETAVKKRAELVEKFNSDEYIPFMVLSLKAGGVGLNLTAANHVIHFDRWWNPAVENQATDRAFRIGQTKNVIVHKFITSGTVEEKIDRMIEDKQQLAGEIIADSGENWITEMGNNELIELFRLAR